MLGSEPLPRPGAPSIRPRSCRSIVWLRDHIGGIVEECQRHVQGPLGAQDDAAVRRRATRPLPFQVRPQLRLPARRRALLRLRLPPLRLVAVPGPAVQHRPVHRQPPGDRLWRRRLDALGPGNQLTSRIVSGHYRQPNCGRSIEPLRNLATSARASGAGSSSEPSGPATAPAPTGSGSTARRSLSASARPAPSTTTASSSSASGWPRTAGTATNT